MGTLAFGERVLFFPVTPFEPTGRVDLDLFQVHVQQRLDERPGAVFAACGTGEFHALSAVESTAVVRAAVQVVGGRVPVVAGVGGPLGAAVEGIRAAADAGADAALLLPPYLVTGTMAGLVAWVRAVMDAADLPVIVYHRGAARFSADAVRSLAADPKLIGFKDGIGDIGLAQEIALAAAHLERPLALFNGLLTAEVSQAAYRAIGIPLYSSAAFAMIPEVATAYFDAYTRGDEETREILLRRFYQPLVALRDETPGFGVALIKAGIRLRGLPVGSVRPPLVDPDPDQERRLAELIETGLLLAGEIGRGTASPA